MIDLTILGTGGGMPIPDRFLASLFINYIGNKILIDCGEGTQVSMKIANCGFKSINLICITHTHGDHIVGLPGLLSTIGNSGRTEPLTIIGPEGITEAINGLMVINKYLPYKIDIIENPINKINIIKNLEISTINLDHSSPCLGYSFYFKRNPEFLIHKAIENNVPKTLWSKLQKNNEIIIENGITYTPEMVMGKERKGVKLSYITDTRPISTIPPFIQNSNYFICEGTYGDNNDLEKAIANKHMTFKESATLAKEGNVHKLVLTHFSTAMNNPEEYLYNATEIFPNTIIGTDRYKENLKFSI